MPRLIAQIPAALNTPTRLLPESTEELAERVAGSSAFRKAPANPGAPGPKTPEALPLAGPLHLRPIDFLRHLGIAMLPPEHVAQNLASWHWTLLRYAYLIESLPAGALATNDLAGDYRYHHMTALSEAFGVGCALSYADFWLRSQVPRGATVRDPVDLDYVLHGSPAPGHPAVPRAHRAPNASRHPDYLVTAEHEGTVRLLLVECKGNSRAGRSFSIDQLGSAMHQLEGVRFQTQAGEPVAVDKHAYATRMTKGGGPLEMLAIDPASEGRRWIEPRRMAVDRLLSLRDQPEAVTRDASAEEIGGLVLERLDDAVLAWSGLESTEFDPQQLERRESDFGDVAGTASTLQLPDGRRVEVFTGAALDALEAARQGDFAQAHERRAGLRRAVAEASGTRPQNAEQRGEEPPPGAARLSAADDPERVASAVAEDGTVLRIEVQ